MIDGTRPLAGGNFIDNVLNKSNIPIKAEELIVQTRPPRISKAALCLLSSSTKLTRSPPIVLLATMTAEPWTQRLPFQAYGAIGMARGEDVDSAQEDFFFLKWRQALVAPGRNTLDGYYSCLGYVVSDNLDLLGQVEDKGAKIVSAKVVAGAENLVQGNNKAK